MGASVVPASPAAAAPPAASASPSESGCSSAWPGARSPLRALCAMLARPLQTALWPAA